MKFNKRKAFIDSFPMYMMSFAVWLIGIKIGDFYPNTAYVAYNIFTWFAILILIPSTAYLITGAMKTNPYWMHKCPTCSTIEQCRRNDCAFGIHRCSKCKQVF